MEKINLYIDFDGVILDTINPLYQKLKEDNVPEEKVKEFFVNYDWTKIIKDSYSSVKEWIIDIYFFLNAISIIQYF